MQYADVMDYSRQNRAAMLLLHTATQDYVASRCLLINGLAAGFALGAQAIEKFLKALISFDDSTVKVSRTHCLPSLLTDAESRYPNLVPLQFGPTAQYFFECYQTRYPDNKNQPNSMDTGKLVDLDEMVIGLNNNLPCPRNVRLRSGIFATVTFSLNSLNIEKSDEKWIKVSNLALNPLLGAIAKDYFATMREMYPHSPESHF